MHFPSITLVHIASPFSINPSHGPVFNQYLPFTSILKLMVYIVGLMSRLQHSCSAYNNNNSFSSLILLRGVFHECINPTFLIIVFLFSWKWTQPIFNFTIAQFSDCYKTWKSPVLSASMFCQFWFRHWAPMPYMSCLKHVCINQPSFK